jgi:lipoprotein-releasing system permease protein
MIANLDVCWFRFDVQRVSNPEEVILKFEPFIARRYLFSGQHKALVSVITIISIAGVAVGVFALIVVIAVMEGFDANLVDKIIGSYAHMEVVRTSSQSAPVNPEEMLKTIRAIPEVKAAGPVIMRQALVQVPAEEGEEPRQIAMFVQGVDMEVEPQVTKVMEKVSGNAKPGPGEIVLGKKAAQKLVVPIGGKLTVFSPRFVTTATGRTALARNAVLAGVFETGFPETDEMVAYTSIETARALFLLPEDEVDGIHLVVNNVERVEGVRDKVAAAVGGEYTVTTWRERNPILFDALQLEKWVMFIILLLIVLVAAFNIIGTLIMVVIEKTREIGILKSMGATEGSILRIFMFQGLFIGGIGTGLGAALGLFVCYLLKYHIKIDVMSEAYLSDRIPLLINPWWNVLIVASAMAICLVAAFYPARQAAKLDPVEALRYE